MRCQCARLTGEACGPNVIRCERDRGHAIPAPCALCESAPGTVDAQWHDKAVKVCAACFTYETGEAPPLCSCATITGEYCGRLLGTDPVRLDWVPPSDRGTAETLGSWRGLSVRVAIARGCWESWPVQGREWCEEVAS